MSVFSDDDVVTRIVRCFGFEHSLTFPDLKRAFENWFVESACRQLHELFSSEIVEGIVMLLFVERLRSNQRNVLPYHVNLVVGVFEVLHLHLSCLVLQQLAPVCLLCLPLRIIPKPNRVL